MGVVLVADSFHLYHVFATDGLITTFVEDDTRIVAVVDDDIAHQFGALFPLAALAVFLCIAGRQHLHGTHAVAALDVLLPGGDVHPAEEVGIALYGQSVAVIAHPGRHAQADTRPLVASALGIAFELQHAVVDPHLAFAEACLAETCAGHHFVHHVAIYNEACFYLIQITVSPTPEVQVAEWGFGAQGGCLALGNHRRFAFECGY